MFRKEQLIFVILLSGCTTITSNESPVLELESVDQVVEQIKETDEGSSFLESIDSTLEEADALLNKIEQNKANTRNKISNLERTHRNDIELISDLQSQCIKKDSIIEDYILHHKLLHEKLKNTKAELEVLTNKHISVTESLIKENQHLKAYVDSLVAQLNYTDSLILTNKKLTKVYETD